MFHVVTLMSQLRLTGEKQQLRSHHRCVSISASRLESEHLPQLRGSQLYKVRVQLNLHCTPSTIPVSHTEAFLLTLPSATSTAWLAVSCLSAPNVAPSLRVLLPPKINSKAPVISVVAGLGLTSLAFIRNTSLGLCWYKST